MSPGRRWLAAALVALSALGGCDGDRRGTASSSGESPAASPRCAQCGMRTDMAPAFRAGATDRQGDPVAFDSPKCLFRWLAGPRGRGATEPWVTAYYEQAPRPVDQVRYVVGSDVVGPMGHDLIPVAGEAAAERFRADHDGERVVAREAINGDLLDALDAPRDARR